MSTKIKIGLIAVMLVVTSGAFAASAYTSGSVDRAANVNVVNDDTGLIALQDGNSGDLVYQNSSGALEIDFTNGSASGVNTAAHFELGDQANANESYAFNLTNLDAEGHDFTFEYSGTDSEDDDENLQFQVYDDTGVLQTTVSEESGAVNLNGVASGDTYYVVIVVDTHGLTSNSDLSGTLTISA
ncbi:hypothetical protein [Halorarum salinum]|uniref:Uncharacterized protein n=1 Tax=Halorarum salinum TaxID=2743089 RepID=A0A7D5LCD3_9EURY|nr:hypothetical protein [Halobaculum salinum]QLG63214.1 hypothetical protein HUG12_16330 [Halobaculum salinum]